VANRLQDEDGFAAMEAVRDPLMCCGFDEHKMKFHALAQAIKRVTMFYLLPGMSKRRE